MTTIQPNLSRTSIQPINVKPNIIIPNPIDKDINNRTQDQKQKLKEELNKLEKDLENSNLTKDKRAKLRAKRNALEDKIENLNIDDGVINKNEINRAINKDIRGIEVYVHGKPYPDYSYPGYKRPENYLHKIQFRVIGKNDPYALVDENLRQLKNYTKNDVLNEYEDDGTKNINKKNPDEYNTYMMKKVMVLPNNEIQSGGKKKYNRKTNKKYSKNKRKTKRRKSLMKKQRKTKRK